MRRLLKVVERFIGRVEFWDRRIGMLANLEIGAPFRATYDGKIWVPGRDGEAVGRWDCRS